MSRKSHLIIFFSLGAILFLISRRKDTNSIWNNFIATEAREKMLVGQVQQDGQNRETNQEVQRSVNDTEGLPTSGIDSCNPRIQETPIPVEGFQKVSNRTYVYSAYFDGRPEAGQPTVRVMALSQLNVTLFCHLWYPGVNKPLITKADLHIVKHHE